MVAAPITIQDEKIREALQLFQRKPQKRGLKVLSTSTFSLFLKECFKENLKKED